MLASHQSNTGAVPSFHTGNSLPACRTLIAADIKSIKQFRRELLNLYFYYLGFWRTLPAPGQQFIQLFRFTGCGDVYTAVRLVLYPTCYTQLYCFIMGTLTKKNALYFTYNLNRNRLDHAFRTGLNSQFVPGNTDLYGQTGHTHCCQYQVRLPHDCFG